MIPLSEVAKYIDNFERHASFGAILESFLNPKTRDGIQRPIFST